MRALSVIAIISILVLAGCVSWPQNVKEFITWSGEGQKSIVNKPMNTTVAKNSKLFKKCFNVNYLLKSTNKQYRADQTMEFVPSIINEDGVVYFSLQQKNSGYINTGYPKSGMYIFSAKVEKKSNTKTQIITNALWNHKNLETAFHDWSADKSDECPDLL